MKTKFSPLLLLPVFMVLLVQGCSKKQINYPAKKDGVNITHAIHSIYEDGQQATFKITNLAAAKTLEIGNTALNNGAIANLANFLGDTPGHNNQKWKVRNIGEGFYTIMNLGSGKFLEANGINVMQNQATNTKKQLWSVQVIGNGNYKIINMSNGLVLGSTIANASIELAAYTNPKLQGWEITPTPSESYRDDEVTRFFQRTTGSTAFDGGASIPLSTGQVLWVTNDTFYNQINATGNFDCGTIFPYRNSSLLQPASKSWDPALTVNIMSPFGVETFRTANNKNLLWPGAGIQVGNKVYVHTIEVPRNNLDIINQYLSVVTIGNAAATISSVQNLSIPGLTGQTGIIYSLGMVKPNDGYVYVYGAGGHVNSIVYVARFAENNPALWTFWDGTIWAKNPTTTTSAQVGKGPINNNTVGYIKGKYILVAMDFGFACDAEPRNVYTSISTSPTGPFTNKKYVYTLPDMKQGHKPVFYNPTIHAEFDNGDNELLVNYCVNWYGKNNGTNATCLPDCSNPDGSKDPNDYRPKGIRIPYSVIGLE